MRRSRLGRGGATRGALTVRISTRVSLQPPRRTRSRAGRCWARGCGLWAGVANLGLGFCLFLGWPISNVGLCIWASAVGFGPFPFIKSKFGGKKKRLISRVCLDIKYKENNNYIDIRKITNKPKTNQNVSFLAVQA